MSRSPLDVAVNPFQRVGGTPMAAAIIRCVPDWSSRWNITVSSFQGGTPESAPKP